MLIYACHLKLSASDLVVWQAAFSRAKKIFNPQGTGVVLCGQKQMAEVCYCFCLEFSAF